ncbi:GntR family transcriptional regulator [Lactiplantibacillus carotarum]|uniref:GntR family transcriptional regulator n=1 Tax=Lactiplantibacillus carotarum TaxID=2993456 RepID=UPI00298EF3E8|nr:GntR family transcriptional regulator [Lactiplantibacillus carotarum]
MSFATNGAPYYEQLVMTIKQQIVQGVLQPGDKLPSVRAMAATQHLNPNTVSKAYQLLESQRAVYTVKGRGTFVSAAEEPVGNAKELQKIQDRLTGLLTEAQFLGISVEQIQTWVQMAYQSGGNQK